MSDYGTTSAYIPWSSSFWDATSTVHYLTTGYDWLGQYWANPWATQYTSSGNDLIIARDGTWQANDYIDGGAGVDTIQAKIAAGYFVPTVRNVERAELVADANSGTIDFSNWTGLKYVELNGSGTTAVFGLHYGHTWLGHLTPGTEVNIHDYSFGSFQLEYASQ